MRRLFIMRKDLNMSAGKLAAQVGHCAEAYWMRLIRAGTGKQTTQYAGEPEELVELLRLPKDIYDDYICGSFVKTICEARNKNHLLKAKQMADDLGLRQNVDYGLIYDLCLTELEPEEEDGTTLTGIWFKPLDDEIAHRISKKYQLYH